MSSLLFRNALTHATLQSRSRQKSIGFFDKVHLTAENGDIGRPVGTDMIGGGQQTTVTAVPGTGNPLASTRRAAGADLKQDFRVLQQKRQMAEMTR